MYAVDLAPARLARVSARVPWIETIVAPADRVPEITDGSLDFVCSTMVMEHVPDERTYLAQIRRLPRPGGRAYLTTVFKKPWAWYFRKRDGESVLDTSHLREYTDVESVRALVLAAGLEVLALERRQLWFRSSIHSSPGSGTATRGCRRGNRCYARSGRPGCRSRATTASK